MGVLESIYSKFKNYNTRRKILNILGEIKQFSKDQREKVANLILLVHEKADGMLESVIKREYPNEIAKLEKEYFLVKDHGRYFVGRYLTERVFPYERKRAIIYAPFMRTGI